MPGTGFGTDPCRSIFKRVQSVFSPDFTDNANVNLVRIGERYIAMTETPLPIEFDRRDAGHHRPAALRRQGRRPGHHRAPTPRSRPQRARELLGRTSRARASTGSGACRPARTARRLIASLPVAEPAYMHAFGMSERYLILAEYPLRVNPLKLAFSGRAFIKNYRWQPEQGTRFQVVDRETGALRGTYETDAFFAFHHVNAFERGDELVVDLVAFDDSTHHRLALPRRARPGGGDPAERAAPLHDRPRLRHGRATSRWPRAPSSCRGSTTRAATRATTASRTSRAAAPAALARPAREGRRGPGRGGLLARGRLLSGRADLRARPGRGDRGRRA